MEDKLDVKETKNMFIVRHNAKSEQQIMNEHVFRLIHEYDIKDYEIKGVFWVKNEILFNGKIIAAGSNIEYKEVQENFIRVMRGQEPEL